MDVGKYQVIQYRTFANGFQDTLEWLGYGPQGVVNQGYSFFTNENINSNTRWQVDLIYSRVYHFLSKSTGSTFEITSFQHDRESMEVEYQFNAVYGGNNLDTSQTGKVVFKRLPL